MYKNYNLARHPNFDKFVQKVIKNNKQIEEMFKTAIKKLVSEPHKVGKPLKGAPPDLKIWRLWIGGKSGFRIFYNINREKNTVVALVVSRKT